MLRLDPRSDDANPATHLRIGYVLKRFPRLTETFILNEILELERQGVHVEIYSLLLPRDEPRHKLLSQLKARIHYLSDKTALKNWKVGRSNGPDDADTAALVDCLGQNDIMSDLMPGKKPADAALLMHRATTIALLAEVHGIQHLHAHFGSDAATAALLAGRIARLPYSYTAHARDIYHTYVSEQADRRMRRRKLLEALFVVTVSEYNRLHLIEIANSDSRCRVMRLYNGIDLDRFGQSSNEQRDGNHLLCVARLVEKKGVGDLIVACKMLKEQNFGFKCTIVGDGPLRADYQSAIKLGGLEQQVRFTGALPQDEVLSLMQSATMMVLPCVIADSGDRDGLPTVLLESLACGLPIISTNVAGIPEIVESGSNGLLVPPGCPAELNQAINQLLCDENLRTKFAEAGRRKAEKDFCLATNVARLREYFAPNTPQHSNVREGHARAHRIY